MKCIPLIDVIYPTFPIFLTLEINVGTCKFRNEKKISLHNNLNYILNILLHTIYLVFSYLVKIWFFGDTFVRYNSFYLINSPRKKNKRYCFCTRTLTTAHSPFFNTHVVTSKLSFQKRSDINSSHRLISGSRYHLILNGRVMSAERCDV